MERDGAGYKGVNVNDLKDSKALNLEIQSKVLIEREEHRRQSQTSKESERTDSRYESPVDRKTVFSVIAHSQKQPNLKVRRYKQISFKTNPRRKKQDNRSLAVAELIKK